jgi:hypothetical protein
MTIDLEKLPPEAREEIERLRSVNASMGAYLKMVEAALLAAWRAGETTRSALMDRPDEELSEEERLQREAWQLVNEIVVRVPDER